MTLANVLNTLDTTIPDDIVERELRPLLRQEAREDGRVYIEFDEVEGGSISVPIDAEFEIITKAFFKEYIRTQWRSFLIQVAIGGAFLNERGLLTSKYCFATLLFNGQGQRFTIDFHLEVR